MPVVSTEYNGMLLNRANGYSAQMDATYLRDCITPVDDDRTLSLRVDTYGATVMALYYELRSMDGERLLENYDIEDWTQSDDAILFDVTLQNLMEAGQEYVTVIDGNSAGAVKTNLGGKLNLSVELNPGQVSEIKIEKR